MSVKIIVKRKTWGATDSLVNKEKVLSTETWCRNCTQAMSFEKFFFWVVGGRCFHYTIPPKRTCSLWEDLGESGMYTYVCVYIYTYIYTERVENPVYTYIIHTYVCIHTYVHTQIHTCAHTYIHAYIHTYAQRERAREWERERLWVYVCI